MKFYISIFAALIALVTYSCGNDDDDDAVVNPTVPTLGTQIDRMGRAAVNTALTYTFSADDTAAATAKDKYNADGAASFGTHKEHIKDNLGIYDSLDANCGNQFGAASTVSVDQYDTLGGVLADDKLYVNSVGEGCTTYLAVEANATDAIPNSDCGGRNLTMDVVDVTYSTLALGNPVPTDGAYAVSDGVSADDKTHSNTTFPWVAAP
jgi:hypothetical protein